LSIGCSLQDLVLEAQRVIRNPTVREIWLDWDHDLRGAFPSDSIEKEHNGKAIGKTSGKADIYCSGKG
jgi:hypothetical protein